VSSHEERRVRRGQKRREEIAIVAEQVFLELGFTEATMQIVATRAGASKETLYRHFGCKAELFSEVMNARCERFMSGAEEACSSANEPAVALKAVGLAVLNLIVSPSGLSVYRLVVSETLRAPELGQIFYELGPKKLYTRVADYLAMMTKAGKLDCPDPLICAELFLGAVNSGHQMRELVMPNKTIITEERKNAYVDEAVQMFLARYGRA